MAGTGITATNGVLSTTVGDITSVVAGTGLTGGGTSGDVTVNVIGGDGITANANDVALSSSVAGNALDFTSGVIDVAVDNSSIEPDSEELQIKALGVTNAMLAGSIAASKLADSSITVTDGSNSTATSLGGTVTFSAGEGIDVAESSGTVRYSAEDATTSNKGVASFSSDNFAASSGAITIKDAGVATAELQDNAVTTAKITDSNVTTVKIADSNVTLAKMAANSVDSNQYVDGSIDTAHIANDQITSALIADNAIDSDMYVDGSIDEAHIANAAVAVAKMKIEGEPQFSEAPAALAI
jgi:hypothetical protein